jgi:hypothetical protein
MAISTGLCLTEDKDEERGVFAASLSAVTCDDEAELPEATIRLVVDARKDAVEGADANCGNGG